MGEDTKKAFLKCGKVYIYLPHREGSSVVSPTCDGQAITFIEKWSTEGAKCILNDEITFRNMETVSLAKEQEAASLARNSFRRTEANKEATKLRHRISAMRKFAAYEGHRASHYEFSKKAPPSSVRSRRYVSNVGAQNFTRALREEIFDHCVEIDIEASHLPLALYLVRRWEYDYILPMICNVSIPAIQKWLSQRTATEEILQRSGDRFPKTEVLSTLYGYIFTY